MNRYEILEKVGEGAYGEVMKCRSKDTGEIVAIKKFKEADNVVDKEQSKKTMFRELKMLRELRHDNIVPMKEAFRRKGRLYIVFEYIQNTLLDIVEGSPEKGIELAVIRKIMYQIAKAVQYCHSRNVIHRDIKPENILVGKDKQVKLCDFGFARSLPGKQRPLTDYVATRWYRAPELLLGCQYDKQVDIWAMGCVLGEMVDGKPLFPGDTELDQIFIIQNIMGTLTPEQRETFMKNPRWLGSRLPEVRYPQTLERRYFNKLDTVSLSFLKGLLVLDPAKRLTAEECLSHDFFEDERRQDKLARKEPLVPSLNLDMGKRIQEEINMTYSARNQWAKRHEKSRHGFKAERSRDSRTGRLLNAGQHVLISETFVRSKAATPQPNMKRSSQYSPRSRLRAALCRAPTSLGDYIGTGHAIEEVDGYFTYRDRLRNTKRKSSRNKQETNTEIFHSPRSRSPVQSNGFPPFGRSSTSREYFHTSKLQKNCRSTNHLPSIHDANNMHIIAREDVEYRNGPSQPKRFALEEFPVQIEDRRPSRLGRTSRAKTQDM